ncbi:MAG: hypothetical protein H0U68_06855, partial [Ramlibacter sp.]|nr:hypothetical protein [Ramlibacter sp.]
TATAPLLPQGAAPVRVASAAGVEHASVQQQQPRRDAQLPEAAPVRPFGAMQAAGDAAAVDVEPMDAGQVDTAVALVNAAPQPSAHKVAADASATLLDAPSRGTQPAMAASRDPAAAASLTPLASPDDAAPAAVNAPTAPPLPHGHAAPQPAAGTPAPRSTAVAAAREQTRQLAAQLESFGNVSATTIMAMQRPDHRTAAQGQVSTPPAVRIIGAPAVGHIPASVPAAHPDLRVGSERALPPALPQRIAPAQSGSSTLEAPTAATASSAAPGAGRLDRPNSTPSPPAPIRLHAQWTADGVHLWLALDAGVLAQMGPIVEQLRQWLKLQGVPLLSLVCNGQPVDLDAVARRESDKDAADLSNTFPQENTVWPSVP